MFLYIDPGTGSMLFSILIGVVSTALFFGQRLFMKLKFILSGGKAAKISNSKIPYVIFSDHKRYWNVFKPICDEFEKRGIDIVYWTASPDDPGLSEKYEHVKAEFIGEGNKAFARLNMMNAGICLSTTPGLDVYQWKRSKNVDYYVHIVHMISDPSSYRMFALDFYDAVLVSGPYQMEQIRQIEEKHGVPAKEIKTVGCTYMDMLNNRERPKIESNQKTILLAPTWGESGILSRFGEKIIDALLNTGYEIVIRPHPQSYTAEKDLLDNLVKKYADCKNLSWNRDNDNFDILNKADLLISDYSGVIFDFAFVFKKPFIYADTSFNSAPYDAAWLDEELWTIRVLPEIGHQLKEEDFPQIKSIIDNAISSNSSDSQRNKIIEQCWSNIGSAGKLAADYLIEKSNELNNPKKMEKTA